MYFYWFLNRQIGRGTNRNVEGRMTSEQSGEKIVRDSGVRDQKIGDQVDTFPATHSLYRSLLPAEGASREGSTGKVPACVTHLV